MDLLLIIFISGEIGTIVGIALGMFISRLIGD